MGALLFLSIFLASFLVGSGASTVYQNVSQPNTQVTPTPANASQQACLPEADIISQSHKLQAGANSPIEIGASADLPTKYGIDGLDGGNQDVLKTKDAWTRALQFHFGAVDPDPGDSRVTNPAVDRRRDEWVLIKRGAPVAAWKISYNPKKNSGRFRSVFMILVRIVGMKVIR